MMILKYRFTCRFNGMHGTARNKAARHIAQWMMRMCVHMKEQVQSLFNIHSIFLGFCVCVHVFYFAFGLLRFGVLPSISFAMAAKKTPRAYFHLSNTINESMNQWTRLIHTHTHTSLNCKCECWTKWKTNKRTSEKANQRTNEQSINHRAVFWIAFSRCMTSS